MNNPSSKFMLSSNAVVNKHYKVNILKQLNPNNHSWGVVIHTWGHTPSSEILNLFDSDIKTSDCNDRGGDSTLYFSGCINALEYGENLDAFLEVFEQALGANIVKTGQFPGYRVEYTIENVTAINLNVFEFPYEAHSLNLEIKNKSIIFTKKGKYIIDEAFDVIKNTLSDYCTMPQTLNSRIVEFYIDPELLNMKEVLVDILEYLKASGYNISQLYSNNLSFELTLDTAPVIQHEQLIKFINTNEFGIMPLDLLKKFKEAFYGLRFVNREMPQVYDGIV
jgi:hypothetical protein